MLSDESVSKRIKYAGELSYVEVSTLEVLLWGGYNVCDLCNEEIHYRGYLIYLLNSCICEKCFREIESKYKSRKVDEYDLKLQKENQISFYKYHLQGGKL